MARDGLGITKNEPLAIVAAGPSLEHTIDRVREFKHVLVCGSAHDYLVRQGVVPTYALVCDGGKEDKGNLSMPQKETTYLIASQCDPGLFDHLADYRVEQWHYRGQAASDLDQERVLLNGEPSLSWGSSVTIVSIQLCMLLGYQDLHFFGFDSCYGGEGSKQHVCKIHGSMDYQKMPATIGTGAKAKTFVSDLALLEQANQFFRIAEAQHQWIKCTIYGGGLIAEMVRQGDPELQKYVSLA